MNTIFKITSCGNNKLEKFKERAVQELNEFFEKNRKADTFKIILINDRKTINEWHGKETEPWLAGWGLSTNAVIILNPDSFSSESSHTYSDEEYFKFLKHELCHLYFQTIYSLSSFPWINEGVSVFTANQIEHQSAPKKFIGFLDKKNLYWESGYAIKRLVDNFGKEKLFEFLREQSGIKDTSLLNEVFDKTYHMPLNYDAFNNLQ